LTGWTVCNMPYLSIVLFVLTVDIKTLLDAGNSSNHMVRNWILAVFHHFSVNGLTFLQRLNRIQLSEIFSGSVASFRGNFVFAVIKSITWGQSAWVCKTKYFSLSSETKRREFCSRKIVNKKKYKYCIWRMVSRSNRWWWYVSFRREQT